MILYLKYTRLIAFTDNKFDINDSQWEKELWTLKIQECTNRQKDGIYYMIYSDTNHGGQPNKKECLRDPVTNKYIYSHYCQEDNIGDKSKYVLLKEFGIKNIEISCYARGKKEKTIGKISFGHDGKIYTKLGDNKNEIKSRCYIDIYDKFSNKNTIIIEPSTGFVHKFQNL